MTLPTEDAKAREILDTLERLAATQRNLPVPMTIEERAKLREAAKLLTQLTQERDDWKEKWRNDKDVWEQDRERLKAELVDPSRDEEWVVLCERADRAEARIKELDGALQAFVDWHGGAHAWGCPEDDTCDCAGKPINDSVNLALASGPAPQKERR